MKLDPLDAAILRLLREDARLSFRRIAEAVGASTPTVSARVKTLEDLGVIRGYHAAVDARILGGTLHVAQVRARPDAGERVREALAALAGVEDILMLEDASFVIRYRERPPEATVDTFHAALKSLQGVTAFTSSRVLDAHAGSGSAALPDEVHVACHQCKGPVHGEGVHARFAERAHVFCCKQCLAQFRKRFEQAEKGA